MSCRAALTALVIGVAGLGIVAPGAVASPCAEQDEALETNVPSRVDFGATIPVSLERRLSSYTIDGLSITVGAARYPASPPDNSSTVRVAAPRAAGPVQVTVSWQQTYDFGERATCEASDSWTVRVLKRGEHVQAEIKSISRDHSYGLAGLSFDIDLPHCDVAQDLPMRLQITGSGRTRAVGSDDQCEWPFRSHAASGRAWDLDAWTSNGSEVPFSFSDFQFGATGSRKFAYGFYVGPRLVERGRFTVVRRLWPGTRIYEDSSLFIDRCINADRPIRRNRRGRYCTTRPGIGNRVTSLIRRPNH